MFQKTLTLCCLILFTNVQAQISTGINNLNPSPKAALDIKGNPSVAQGLLIPRYNGDVATSFGLSGNANPGLLYYDSTNQIFRFYKSAGLWGTFGGNSSGAWSLTGNAGSANTNFLGTSDARRLRLATNGLNRIVVDSARGFVHVGNGYAKQRLHVAGQIALDTILRHIPNVKTGILVADTSNGIIQYVSPANLPSNEWRLVGNANADSSNFIGTTNGASWQPLIFKTKNIDRMIISSNGNVGIGTTTPKKTFVLVGPNAPTTITQANTFSMLTNESVHPKFELFTYTSDVIYMMFDSYLGNTVLTSSYNKSNFIIQKDSDKFRIRASYGAAPGTQLINLKTAIDIDTGACVGIGAGVNPFAALSVYSGNKRNKGLMLPTLSQSDRLNNFVGISSGDEGLIVYDQTLKSIFMWNGTAWSAVGGTPLSTNGSPNKIARWTSTSFIDTSSITDYGFGSIGIGTGNGPLSTGLTLAYGKSFLQAQSALSAGFANNAGTDLSIQAGDAVGLNRGAGRLFFRTGASTGNSGGSGATVMSFQVSPGTVASGSSPNSYNTVMTISDNGQVSIAGGGSTSNTKFWVRSPDSFDYAIQGLNEGNTTGATFYGILAEASGSGPSKNIGLLAQASGATDNYPAIFMGGNVGIGTLAPKSTLHINGPLTTKVDVVTTNAYTATNTNSVIVKEFALANSVTLQSATIDVVGRIIYIANNGGGLITISPTVGDTVTGITTVATNTMAVCICIKTNRWICK